MFASRTYATTSPPKAPIVKPLVNWRHPFEDSKPSNFPPSWKDARP